MRWLFMLILAACASLPRPVLAPDEQRAVEAFRAAWTGAGMPSLASCHLDRVRVLHTTTATEFTRRCFPYRPEGAASCISQDNVQQGMRVVGLPVVVLRPGEPVDAKGEPIIHELAHAAYSCAYGGMGDPLHTDPRVWIGAGGESSVQGQARALVSE